MKNKHLRDSAISLAERALPEHLAWLRGDSRFRSRRFKKIVDEFERHLRWAYRAGVEQGTKQGSSDAK